MAIYMSILSIEVLIKLKAITYNSFLSFLQEKNTSSLQLESTMALHPLHNTRWCLAFAFLIALLFVAPDFGNAHRSGRRPAKMNVIDKCWRVNPNWRRARQQLAKCSVGFAGKMMNNIGKGIARYVVTDPSDHPTDPKPGTLRYGATLVNGKVWITFSRDMQITLTMPLLVSSFTTIDGRGASVHIAHGSGLQLYKVNDVIIHSLRIHHILSRPAGQVIGPDSKMFNMNPTDGDAIRLIGSMKVWIDHNTLYECADGLLDVTLGSTDVTVSNNWFRNHDKVMLLGHDDGYQLDKNMKVTVVFNHFGPNCNQRMPRVRFGYAHVANNLYQGWAQYAIGGSMNPSIMSESNFFIAPDSGSKKITWRQNTSSSWNFFSLNDVFANGAFIKKTGHIIKPNYVRGQAFRVADANSVKALTSTAGALRNL